MSDQRSANVHRFREEQNASRLYILTTVTPFSVSQDRVIVVVKDGEEPRLIACARCTPRTAFDHGEARTLEASVLAEFLRDLEDAALAWEGDHVPPNVHDGVTVTAEYADAATYRRVRMVDPAPGTPHADFLQAWTSAFDEARRLLR